MENKIEYRVIVGKRVARDNPREADPQAEYNYKNYMKFSEEDEPILGYATIDDILKRMGNDGWELVTALPRQMEERVDASIFVTEEVYIFKRI
jgi:hypothetical protein